MLVLSERVRRKTCVPLKVCTQYICRIEGLPRHFSRISPPLLSPSHSQSVGTAAGGGEGRDGSGDRRPFVGSARCCEPRAVPAAAGRTGRTGRGME